MQALVKGVRKWARSPINLADLVIVCVSLLLEILAVVLSNSETEVGSLLVVFRLWRIVRVMQAVGDVEHHVKDKEKLELDKQVWKLLTIQDAHHTVIKEMHREYTKRVCRVPSLSPCSPKALHAFVCL
jgi:hypothetical protein